jgi:hypothetical protein
MAVRDAPPPAFAGGGKWESMDGEMAGICEVRCRQGGQLHRLFCLLDRNHPDGPALVMLAGDSKPNRDARVRLPAGPRAPRRVSRRPQRGLQLAVSICSTEVCSRISIRRPDASAIDISVAKVGLADEE